MRFDEMTTVALSKVLGECERKQIHHEIEAGWWREVASQARGELFSKMAAVGMPLERPPTE